MQNAFTVIKAEHVKVCLSLPKDTVLHNPGQFLQQASCRQVDEASFRKLERLFDMAMSDPMSEPGAQPRALIKARNKVRLADGLLVRFLGCRDSST